MEHLDVAWRLRTVFLWAVPRSVSTACAKAFSQHSAITLDHEPFTESYYFSMARRSSRYGEAENPVPPMTDYRHGGCNPRDGTRIHLVKELAFQAEPYITDRCLEESRHILICRDPVAVYQSLVALKPDFTEDEFGFTAMVRLLNRMRHLCITPVMAIDGDHFRNKPEMILRQACVCLGIRFESTMLRWDSGNIREWRPDEQLSQAKWHKTLESSTTIVPASKVVKKEIPAKYAGIVEKARGIYHRLLSQCQVGS